jgi:Lipase (class 3)
VAQLCALRLLQQLPPSEARTVSVVTFASPAVGNQALARAVQQAGWQDNFKSFLMPGMFTLLVKLVSWVSAIVLYQKRPCQHPQCCCIWQRTLCHA